MQLLGDGRLFFWIAWGTSLQSPLLRAETLLLSCTPRAQSTEERATLDRYHHFPFHLPSWKFHGHSPLGRVRLIRLLALVYAASLFFFSCKHSNSGPSGPVSGNHTRSTSMIYGISYFVFVVPVLLVLVLVAQIFTA